MATHSSILAWRIATDRGAWWATVYGGAESDTTEQLTMWGLSPWEWLGSSLSVYTCFPPVSFRLFAVVFFIYIMT